MMMSVKSFHKDDILSYVTSSNSIPWLYDLDTCSCVDDVTTVSLLDDVEVGDSQVRAKDSTFSLTRANPSDLPASNDQIQSCKVTGHESFIKSFTASLNRSVVHDAVSVDESKLFVSRLSKLYLRNVAVLGVAMMLSQAPFYGMRSFLSSLNGSSGRWALVAYYVAIIIAMLLLRSVTIFTHIRPKTAVMLCIAAALPFVIVGVFQLNSKTAVPLPFVAAVAGTAAMWMSETHDTYISSLGALCAAISNNQRSGASAVTNHFVNVFTQYLLVMQQLSLLVGNFATSSVYFLTHSPPGTLSTTLGAYTHITYMI